MSQITQSALVQALVAIQTHNSLNSSSVHYLGNNFHLVATADQKASYQNLIYDLQKLLISSKETDRQVLATKILINLQVIELRQNPQDAENIKKICKIALNSFHALSTSSSSCRATSIQKNLSLLLFGHEYIHSASNEAQNFLMLDICHNQNKQVSTFLGTIKTSDQIERFNFNLDYFSPQTSEGIAFLCQWRHLLQKVEIHSLTMAENSSEGLFRLVGATPEELDKLERLSSCSNQEVSNYATKLVSFLKYENALQDHNKVTKVASKIAALIKEHKLFSQENLSFFQEFFPTCHELAQYMINCYVPQKNEINVGYYQKIVDLSKEYFENPTLFNFYYRYLYQELFVLKDQERNKASFIKTYCHPLYPSVLYQFNDFPNPDSFNPFDLNSKESKKLPETTQPIIQKARATHPASKKKKNRHQRTCPQQIEKDIPQIENSFPTMEKPSTPFSQPSFLQTLFANRSFPFKEAFYASRVEEKLAALDAIGEGEEIPEDLWTHAFPTQIDYFVGTAYSLQGTWNNPTTGKKDLLYCIPGEISFRDRTFRGFFTFCFDQEGICYHRHFSKKIGDQFRDEVVNNTMRENIFPTPAQTSLIQQKLKPLIEKIDGCSLRIDPVFESISLKEGEMTFKIFKIIQ